MSEAALSFNSAVCFGMVLARMFWFFWLAPVIANFSSRSLILARILSTGLNKTTEINCTNELKKRHVLPNVQ